MARLPIVSVHADSKPRPTQPLKTARALEALWQEVAALPVFWPRHARKWLRLRRTMRTKQLALAEQRMVAPVGKRNDCASCTSSCCVGQRQRVLLRLKDMGNLIDVGREDLMDHDKPPLPRAGNALSPMMRTRAWQTFPLLRQNAFGACAALTAEGLCSLYPHWPMSCARFPYALDVAAAEVFYSNSCQSFFIHPMNEHFVRQMAASAVAGYNERIKDALLLMFRRDALGDLGLLQHLTLAADPKP